MDNVDNKENNKKKLISIIMGVLGFLITLIAISFSLYNKTLTGNNNQLVVGDIYVDRYASPDNVREAAEHEVSIFTGGSYSSHAGIVLREYGKTAIIARESQIKDGKMRIKFYILIQMQLYEGIFQICGSIILMIIMLLVLKILEY